MLVPCQHTPPLSFPTPCRSRGGGGGALGHPKIFRCGSLCCCVGDCVVGYGHLYPLHSWQDILLTFAEMELDNTTMFPPRTSVMFIRSTEEPVLVQVVGHSEHGDAYRRITYDRDGKAVLHDRASLRAAISVPANVRVRWWCGPPGGVGDRHLATVPQGVVGDRLSWGGERQGGGGYHKAFFSSKRFGYKRVPAYTVEHNSTRN